MAVDEWTMDDVTLEMRDEVTYTFGSADNPRSYLREHLLGDRRYLTSTHGLMCFVGDQLAGSAVLGSPGGASGVHQRSCLLRKRCAFVAVGPYVVRLELPDLRLTWSVEVDPATCFGVYPVEDDDTFIAHGELQIARVSEAGEVLWASGGADVFSEPLIVTGEAVVATDFEGRTYRFDLRTGRCA